MQLKLIYPRWGSDHIPWKKFLNDIKEAGFAGVEIGIPESRIERGRILDMIKDHDLEFIAQHWETQSHSYQDHLKSYQYHLQRLADCKPILVNSHTGKDYFSPKENLQLIETGQEIEKSTGVPITHETHRSRFSYAAHVCKSYLDESKELKLTADLSHWCCVSESLLEDQEETVKQAIRHTYHIHARVGSSQSPQVIDPRDNRYEPELNQFKSWWKSMLLQAIQDGREWITVTPEYGPSPYALYQPLGDKLLGDQWGINHFIAEEIKKIHRELSFTSK
ncbi:hypothetical protein GCM10028791_38820 [Echinicola sediminis]